MRNLNNTLKEGIYGGIKYSPDHICDGAGSGSGARHQRFCFRDYYADGAALFFQLFAGAGYGVVYDSVIRITKWKAKRMAAGSAAFRFAFLLF